MSELVTIDVLPPVTWLASYLHDAEIDFINAQVDTCGAKLVWISQTATRCAGAAANAGLDLSFVHDKVAALSARIVAGSDVFGRDHNYVPLLSYEFIQQHLDRDLQYALIVEQAHTLLSAQNLDQIARRQHVERAIEAVRATSAALRTSIEENFASTRRLQTEIADLRLELDRLWNSLQQASMAFKAAVSRQSGGCGFAEVLTFAALVATVVATGGAGVTAAQATVVALQGVSTFSRTPDASESWYQEIGNDAKAIAAIVKPAGESIGAFRTAFVDAKKLYEEFNREHPQPPNETILSTDYAKLVANKSDFDSAIEPYLGLAEAKEYKRLMDSFVATSETRNNKIIEHDTLVRGIWDMWATIRVMRAEMGAMSAALDVNFDLEVHLGFLDRMLSYIKWNALRSIANLVKALDYMSGERRRIAYDDNTVGAVAAVAATVNSQYMSILESFATAPGTATNLSLPLKDVLTPEATRRLLAGEPAFFSLRPSDSDLFKGRYCVMTSRIALSRLQTGTKDLQVIFEHQGRSVMRGRDGTYQTYSHNPVSAVFQVSREGEIVDSGNLRNNRDQYVGVSPYGPWKLKFSGDQEACKRALQAHLNFDIQSRVLPI